MATDEHEASEVDLADDVEVDPEEVDDRELYTDERPVQLDDETPVDDSPDYVGEELHDLD